MLTSQRWWRSFPFVLALISLIFIGWSAYLSFTYPHDGILSYSNNGVISELDTFGKDDNQLRVGDRIISVDGVPLIDAIPFYVDKSPEEMVIFVVARDGEQKTLPVMLEPPGTELIIDLVVILVLALVFWGMGVGVLSFKPGDMTSNLFFLFTQVSALMLAAGLSSSVGPPIFSSIFNALLWVMGPITVHLHYYFPQQVQFRRRREILLGLYAIALLGGLPYLLLGAKTIRSFLWASQLYTLGLIFLIINLIFVIGLLIYDYRHATSPGVGSRIRIVVLGGVLSLAPIIALTLLPDALNKQPIFSYNVAFLFLGLFPLTYGYAIVRHGLIEIDRHVNRGATFILVFSILAGVYAVLYAIRRSLSTLILFQKS